MAEELQIIEADLSCPDHQRDVLALTAAYACDIMGNGKPLPDDVLDRLIPGLRKHPTTIIFLAYLGSKAVGIATCFLGFSTFAARPLINIHDLAVLPEYRSQGIGRALLQAVAQEAERLGCAKVTLEVQENNSRARGVYESAGFSQVVHVEENGGALFYSKRLELT